MLLLSVLVQPCYLIPDEVIAFPQFTSFQPHYGPEVDSAVSRHEDQEYSWT
jgi:hypothetical protein